MDVLSPGTGSQKEARILIQQKSGWPEAPQKFKEESEINLAVPFTPNDVKHYYESPYMNVKVVENQTKSYSKL